MDMKNTLASSELISGDGMKIPLLGHLIWFSIKETRMTIEELRKLFAKISIPASFLPEEPSFINAYKRATSELSEGMEVKLSNNCTAVYMVRLTAKSDIEIVKSIVRELRDENNKTLSYEEVGRLHFDKDVKDIRCYAHQPEAGVLVDRFKELYKEYSEFLTGKQIRAMFLTIVKSMSPTSVRPSGAVYFIPHQYADTVEKLETLSKELAAYGTTDRESVFVSIPMIDAEKTRTLIEEKFEDMNTRDADAALQELSVLLNDQADKLTPKKLTPYIQKVKDAKAAIARYEGLLNKELSISRTKIDLLNKQVQSLLDKSTQQPTQQKLDSSNATPTTSPGVMTTNAANSISVA